MSGREGLERAGYLVAGAGRASPSPTVEEGLFDTHGLRR